MPSPRSRGERRAFPLDYDERGYAYVERANATLLGLLERYVLARGEVAGGVRVLDVGCGAGANARAVKASSPNTEIVGVEPNPGAAELARQVCDQVYTGTLEEHASALAGGKAFDAVILSDVLEHVVEPVRFLRALLETATLKDATFLVSVPNYAVWYNRVRTLVGSFSYSWSGLYDRTHLRFFTRRSIRELLEHCGLAVLEQGSTPSLVQSAAPLLRRFFEADAARGDHLSLGASPAYRAYSSVIEPVESRICALWPELLAFQIVSVAELPR